MSHEETAEDGGSPTSGEASASGDDGPGAVTRVYRSVSPRSDPHGDPEMDAVGWGILVGVVFLLFPLLPVLAVVRLVSKAVGAVAGRE